MSLLGLWEGNSYVEWILYPKTKTINQLTSRGHQLVGFV
jgi:hypothetical protein